MADRKQFQNVTPADPELVRLLEATRNKIISEDDLRVQRISFAYGNAPQDSVLLTKEGNTTSRNLQTTSRTY